MKGLDAKDLGTKDLAKMNIWIAINNTVRLLAFMILAWSFQHWWIVLFVVFFWTSMRSAKMEVEDNNE